MLNANDLEQLKAKGISEKQIEEQLACFVKGFPFLEIAASASVEKGIMVISKEEQASYMDAWDAYLAKNKKIVKFVPASGAASRMFKNLYEFLSADYKEPMNAFEKKFFSEIEKFAFYKALDKKCVENTGKDIPALVALGEYKEVVSNLLEPKGLNYGQLPKGLLLFHKYADTVRTAMEEHLAEGAMYAKNNAGEVNIHFTVSPEHQALFEQLVADKSGEYEEKFSVKYDVSFSIQKPSTDTVAAAMDNTPFRDKNDKLLFRPGGHGALIENLNDVDADVVFIKNIDNVVPDSFKCSTVIYKKVIAGVLVTLQEKAFRYLEQIETGKYTHAEVEEMIHFLQDDLCIKNPDTKLLEDAELILYIKSKLLRPLRVCGMVKNVGEPGGGPFLAVNPDGTVSLQVLESSQIDMSDPAKKAMFEKGTHFNPVDLVCAVKNHKGEKYNLPDYVDKVLYLDSDTVVDGSLNLLWNLDIGNNYMAGVDDCLSGTYRKLVDIPENGTYCNSGVLILNLNKFRQDNVIQKFLDFIVAHKGFIVFNEQSILNSVFAEKVYILPLKYNVYTLVFTFKRNELMKLRIPHNYSYSEKEYELAKNKPIIVHCTGCFMIANRPWIENSDHPYKDKYMYYRELTPYKDLPLDKDNRGKMSRIYCKVCNALPKFVTIGIVKVLYNYIRPIMFENKRKKHIKG